MRSKVRTAHIAIAMCHRWGRSIRAHAEQTTPTGSLQHIGTLCAVVAKNLACDIAAFPDLQFLPKVMNGDQVFESIVRMNRSALPSYARAVVSEATGHLVDARAVLKLVVPHAYRRYPSTKAGTRIRMMPD